MSVFLVVDRGLHNALVLMTFPEVRRKRGSLVAIDVQVDEFIPHRRRHLIRQHLVQEQTVSLKHHILVFYEDARETEVNQPIAILFSKNEKRSLIFFFDRV